MNTENMEKVLAGQYLKCETVSKVFKNMTASFVFYDGLCAWYFFATGSGFLEPNQNAVKHINPFVLCTNYKLENVT